MKRVLHLGLILFALLGLAGQSTAHVTAFDGMGTSMQMSSGSMSCGDATVQGDKIPCKKVGLQCLDAMGCPAMTLAKAGVATELPAVSEPLKSVPALANALHGRSYGPEIEPPSILV